MITNTRCRKLTRVCVYVQSWRNCNVEIRGVLIIRKLLIRLLYDDHISLKFCPNKRSLKKRTTLPQITRYLQERSLQVSNMYKPKNTRSPVKSQISVIALRTQQCPLGKKNNIRPKFKNPQARPQQITRTDPRLNIVPRLQEPALASNCRRDRAVAPPSGTTSCTRWGEFSLLQPRPAGNKKRAARAFSGPPTHGGQPFLTGRPILNRIARELV